MCLPQVENQSGLSNFIPVLVGNKEVCSEMTMIQQRVDKSLLNEGLQISDIGYVLDSCEACSRSRTALSEFILDIAWLLKEPASENLHRILPVSQIQRFSSLLSFLMQHDSSIVLEKILQRLDVLMGYIELTSEISSGKNDADIRLLNTQIDQAREFLRKHQPSKRVVLHSEHSRQKEECSHQGFPQNDVLSAVTISNQVRLLSLYKPESFLSGFCVVSCSLALWGLLISCQVATCDSVSRGIVLLVCCQPRRYF